ncbi:MAG: ATP-dependent Clp protease proteolytic subunit [Candidatus Bathyarchaeota archaeon]
MLYPRHDDKGRLVSADQMVDYQEHLRGKRVVFASGVITGDMGFHDCLLAYDSLNHEPIKIVITSGGGDLDAAFLLCDTIKLMKSPVYTLGRYCASAAALVLSSGKKRYLMPHAKVMLHPHRLFLGDGGLSDADIDVARQQSQKYKEKMIDLLIENGVKKDREGILKDIENRDFWLEPEEAIAYGLADKIIDKKTLGGWLA